MGERAPQEPKPDLGCLGARDPSGFPAASLDPFALPAPTTARFWLLVVGTLAAAAVPMVLTLTAFREVVPFFGGRGSALPAASMTAVLVLALAIWWFHPHAQMWRRQLRPIPTADLPWLADLLGELCAAAGLARAPEFLWNPVQPAPAAVAFGRLGRHYVGLTGGLVVEARRDPAAFRAIVLHELAHLRNRDVGITSFALAIWWAFVAMVLVPFVPLQAAPALLGRAPFQLTPAAWIGTWSWRIATFWLLVYLTRNSVLRTREVYADLRAASWDGPAGALRRVLERLPRRGHGWRGPWRVHPDPDRRRRLVDDPAPLFAIGFWEALAAGCAVSLAITDLLGTVLLGDANPGWVLVVATVLSSLPAGVVSLGLWRSAYAARAGGAPPRVARVGLGLGLGLALGPNLSLDAVALELTGRGRFAGLRPSPADLLVDLLVVAGALLVVWWMAGSARAWMSRFPAPRQAAVAGLVVGSIVLGGLAAAGLDAALLTGVTPAGVRAVPLVLLGTFASLPGAAAVACLWAFPLAAEVAAGASVRPELRLGLRAGLLFWPLAILDVFVVRPPGPLHNLGLAFAVLQAAAGFLAARRGGSAPRGLLAASVAAWVSLPLNLLVVAADGTNATELTVAFALWCNGGAAVAYAFALLGRATGRRPRGSPAPR